MEKTFKKDFWEPEVAKFGALDLKAPAKYLFPKDDFREHMIQEFNMLCPTEVINLTTLTLDDPVWGVLPSKEDFR